jgi:uncharacterized membrane protein YfcA
LHIDLYVAAAGLLVGFTVGLTGMGGGALMTPLLVLLFKVEPLAAISSDLVAAVVMKPVGGGVHLRRRTVNWALVRWLMAGSVPAAFAACWCSGSSATAPWSRPASGRPSGGVAAGRLLHRRQGPAAGPQGV